MVQLAPETKRKVLEISRDYPLNLNGMQTILHLNFLPLESYDVLIGMDWLESHKVILNYLDKSFVCINDGENYIVQGIPRKNYVSKI